MSKLDGGRDTRLYRMGIAVAVAASLLTLFLWGAMLVAGAALILPNSLATIRMSGRPPTKFLF